MSVGFGDTLLTINMAQKSMMLFLLIGPFRQRMMSKQNLLILAQCELWADALLPNSVLYSNLRICQQQVMDQFYFNREILFNM